MDPHWLTTPHLCDRRPRFVARYVLVAGLLVIAWLATRVQAAQHDLSCPSGRTTWLSGVAAPGLALVVEFAGVTVGGGTADTSGAWAIPLLVRERPGIYPVVVRQRYDHAPVAAFTCFVDLPVGAAPTGTPTARVGPTLMPTLAPITISPTSTPTPTPPSVTGSTLTSPSVATATASFVETTSPVEPTLVSTATPSVDSTPPERPAIALVAIQPDDPAEPGLFEYVIVENQAAVAHDLGGWRLAHHESGAAYAFPAVILPPGELLILWSGAGIDDPVGGSLFWPTPISRWSPGTTAHLLTPDGAVASTFVIPLAPVPGGS